MHQGYERVIMDFYRHQLTVALPLTIIAVKLIVRVVTREPRKDIFRSILVLPLDLNYIAIGLLLAGIARRIPAFAAHYTSETDADFGGAILFVVLFCIAAFLTWLDRKLRLFWQKFYAAWNLLRNTRQIPLPGQENVVSPTVTRTLLWIFFYWAIMVRSYS